MSVYSTAPAAAQRGPRESRESRGEYLADRLESDSVALERQARLSTLDKKIAELSAARENDGFSKGVDTGVHLKRQTA